MTLFGNIAMIWQTGLEKVTGKISGIISLVLIASTFLTVNGTKVTLINGILLFMGITILVLIGGYTYTKLGLLNKENERTGKENPQLMEILEIIKKIEKEGKQK